MNIISDIKQLMLANVISSSLFLGMLTNIKVNVSSHLYMWMEWA